MHGHLLKAAGIQPQLWLEKTVEDMAVYGSSIRRKAVSTRLALWNAGVKRHPNAAGNNHPTLRHHVNRQRHLSVSRTAEHRAMADKGPGCLGSKYGIGFLSLARTQLDLQFPNTNAVGDIGAG